VTAARRLGIVDWGIGGIGLLQRLDVVAPQLPVVYCSDTGAVPYGKQQALQLRARLRAVVIELASRGCTEAVLACHSASTVVDRLDDCPIPVTGIIEHALRAVPDEFEGTVGVVGGRRTITSGVYRRALAARGISTVSAVAQPLSAHIEAGRMGSEQFRRDLRDIVEPIRGAQALVLACTHYPAAADEFAAALPGALLIDPAATAAAALADGPSSEGDGGRTFLTTGDPHAMRRAAKLAWDYDTGRPAAISIEVRPTAVRARRCLGWTVTTGTRER
jgi:glutamate racemase